MVSEPNWLLSKMQVKRMKSPNLTESKVAKYIKYGQVDLKNEEPRLTAAVYLRNLKKEGAKKQSVDKN